MKKPQYYSIRNFLSSILLVGLSALTMLSCGDEPLTGTQEAQKYSAGNETIAAAEMQAQTMQMAQTASPEEISKAFFAMLDKVSAMSTAEIDSLSEHEILELGKPILDATRNTIQVDEKTIQEIASLADEKSLFERNRTKRDHLEVSKQIDSKISSARISARELQVYDVKNILLDTQKTESIQSLSTCSSLFNVSGGNVFLFPGDQLNLANSLCPAGSYFYLTGGTYYGQYVSNLKNGNRWVGAGSWQAILDGQGSTSRAFGSSNITNNEFRWFIIRNYTSDGIFSGSGTNTGIRIEYMNFANIAPDSLGEYSGAVRFGNCDDIEVSDSYFEDVSAGVLFTNCDGPLNIINNEALNPGRNFFQCDKCEGGGIRVNGNSLEHTTGYGNAVLEDWINIFDSEGISSDYIQVNNNRARVILSNGQATKVSNSGCMVILGDAGGKYQEAKNNIGVNPGNCGIGVADGQYMKVRGNKMYSQAIPGISNVGFYAIDFYDENNISCTDINFYSGSSDRNEANWICASPKGDCDPQNPVENRADANGSCKDQNNSPIIRSSLRNLIKNETFDAGIWNQW